MKKSLVSLFAVSALVLNVCLVPSASGHGVPIDVLPAPGSKLAPTPFASEANLALIGGALLSTSLPGLNGSALSSGDELYLTTHLGLLYFDGTDLAPTTAELLFENHDGDSITLTATTGIGETLYWGTHNGSPSWHIHGNYTIFPHTVPSGVYGLILTASVNGYDDSDPFIIALGHNASPAMMSSAIAAFETELVPEPTAVSLLVCGAAGLGWIAYRRRSAY